MSTDMVKLQKRKNIIKPIISQERCIKRDFQGIHDRFWIDSEFRASQLDHGPDEEGLYWNGRACGQEFLPLRDASRMF